MRDKEYYVKQMTEVKGMKIQPIDSITMVSLAALLADYHDHLTTHPECTIDEFYDFKRLKLLGQKSDTEEWKSLIENDPKYQTMMATQSPE